MDYRASLIVVSDIERSRTFYETVLCQNVKYNYGENIMFESGLSIHLKPHYAELIGVSEDSILKRSHNFELYFEEMAFDVFLLNLKKYAEIQYIQRLVEHSWGQRSTRFYDPDGHIIEVGESMKSVVQKLITQGLSLEEVAHKTQHPIEFVIACME